ncbi:MAG: hypothetical protein Q8880_08685, partial [Bacteroidota bacterium]|nr:hypothetical protein [Bacteroidota bacterium]
MRKTNVLRILLIFLLLSFCSVEISFAQKKKKEPAKPDCNALFSVYAYNKKDSCINNSKGFFIDTTGTGITLIGVFKGATSIKIITSDSSVFEVDRITGVDETGGIVRFSIKNPESRMFYFFKTVDYKVDSNDKVFAFKNKVLDEGVLTKVKLIPQYGNLMFCNFNKRFLQNGEAVFNKVYQLIGIANESLLGDSSNIFVIDIERIKKFKTIRRANSLQDDISRIFFNNYFLKGLIAVDNSHVDTAIACFSKAIENYSRDPEVYLQRAELYVLKNEYKKAIMDYTSVLERDTKNDNAYYGIGNCYFNMHMFNEGFDS